MDSKEEDMPKKRPSHISALNNGTSATSNVEKMDLNTGNNAEVIISEVI